MDDKDFSVLFEKIYPMIEDRVRELFPLLLQEYKKDLSEKIDIDISTTLNGKLNSLEGLKEDIYNLIERQLNS